VILGQRSKREQIWYLEQSKECLEWGLVRKSTIFDEIIVNQMRMIHDLKPTTVILYLFGLTSSVTPVAT
jgi:hypothetical protein